MSEFDLHAEDYRATLDRAVAMGGEGSRYFAEGKASYLARLLGRDYRGRILDYGCGVGLLSDCLLDALPEARLEGYDVSEKSIEAIPAEVKGRGAFTARAADLGTDYGAIILSNVLHHVEPAERAGLLAFVAARLGPQGIAVVFEHNPWNPATRWVVAHCPFDEHAVLLSRRESVGLLGGAGLSIRRKDYVTFFPGFLRWMRGLEPILGWLPAGAQYSVVAAKPPG